MPPRGRSAEASADQNAAAAAAATSLSAAHFLPSSDPSADARALTALFPSRYSLEDAEGNGDADGGVATSPQSSVTALVGKSDVILLVRMSAGVGGSDGGGIGGGNASSSSPRASSPMSLLPSATIVMGADEVSSAIARLGRTPHGGAGGKEGMPILVSRSSSTSPGTIWCAIRMPGGSAVMLASHAALASGMGRAELALAVATGKTPALLPSSPSVGVASRGMVTVAAADDGAGGNAPGAVAADAPPPPTYDFPSLSTKILSGGMTVPGFVINSRVGIPIDNDLFEGQILLIMKPPNSAEDDPYWHEKVFSKKKRKFEVQIQGRFKRTPTGTVYCGAEVTEPMKLGLVSKGLCNVLLKTLTRVISADMHYSFGSDEDDSEMAHIVFTAWSFFDRLVVTKEGETPPPMGEQFPEPDREASKRKSSSGRGEWKSGVTYSMSFHSMYLDLPTWHLRSLPMMKDIDLRTFWGDSSLRIVIYEKGGSESRHLPRDNTYFFAIETEFLGVTDAASGRKVKVDDRDTLPWDKTKRSAIARVDSTYIIQRVGSGDDDDLTTNASASYAEGERPISESTEDEESDSDETAFFDAAERESQTLFEEDAGIGLDIDGGLEVTLPLAPELPTGAAQQPPTPTSTRAVANNALVPSYDLFCPGWVEMCVERGKYRKVYAIVVGGGAPRVRYVSASEFAASFSTDAAKKVVERTYSPRLSSSERQRRVMGLTISSAAKAPSNSKKHIHYRAFGKEQSTMDARFLRRVAPPHLNVKVRGATIMNGFAARAISERHWKEEWVVLTERYVSFFHPDSRKPTFRVSLGGIVGVSKLPRDECPNFPGCQVIAIETTGRKNYLMFMSEEIAISWLDHLSVNLATESQPESPRETNMILNPLSSLGTGSQHEDFLALNNDPAEEFLHKTTVFSCKDRRVLNCRKFSFAGIDRTRNPCEVVASALRKALEPTGDSEISNLRSFLDDAADLKSVDLSDLSGIERMAFFLNLYHVMVTHAYLVLGAPDSSFKWVSYFNMIAYQCSDEIFSLTELEHCIIRERTSSPSQFVAKFVLPKSRYPNFSLQGLVDWRINFCLNCGSKGNPRTVPIYRPETLLNQINQSTRRFLKECVKVRVDPKKKGDVILVTLPRICQWYATDFGRGRSSDIVRLLMKYLGQKEQEILSGALAPDGRHFKSGALSAAFSPFDYQCRLLTLHGD